MVMKDKKLYIENQKRNPRALSKAMGRLFMFMFLTGGMIPYSLSAQDANSIKKQLIQSGFENVGVTENDSVRTIVIQPTPYNVVPDGVKEAIRLIDANATATSRQKKTNLIVLENNVPQMSVSQQGNGAWTASKDLGISLGEFNKIKKENRSYGKVDLVFYPEFFFRNIRYSVMYEVLLNLNPTLEVSLWKGMKFTGQLVIPIINEYGDLYEKVRPGIVTLSQTFRLPYRTNVTATAGFFSDFRHGFAVYAEHYLPRNAWGQFWLDAQLAWTKNGRFDGWVYKHAGGEMVTGLLGVNYYWKRHNAQFALRGHRFMQGEYGVRFQAIRHFRIVSIGLYATKIQKMPLYGHNGFDAGFMFALNFPPRKSKRHGYIPRPQAGDMSLRYSAGGDKRYGFSFMTAPDDNLWNKVNNNSEFIQSYIN